MKGNPFFGTMRGKLGEQVFMRTGGEQRARTYLKVISNPRTKSQMSQRVKLANLVGFYRLLRPLLGDSFLRRPANQSSYNAFVKANLVSSRVYLTKEQASSGYVITAPYTITDGTLQQSNWDKVTPGFDFTDYVTPFEGTAGVGYALQEGFKNAYLAYYPDADESDVLLFVSVIEQSGGIAPTMSIHPMYLSQLDGSDSWFAKHIVSAKPAELTGTGQYVYKASTNESLAIVRARISNNRIVICSTESLSLGVSANLRQGQFNTQLALNSAINSYGMGSGFAIQEAVHNGPMAKKQGSYWVLTDGTLVSSITFEKPGVVNPSTAVMCFTGVESIVPQANNTEIVFAGDANKPENEVQLGEIKYNESSKSLIIKLESMEIGDSSMGLEGLRLQVTLKDSEENVLLQSYSAPFTITSITA